MRDVVTAGLGEAGVWAAFHRSSAQAREEFAADVRCDLRLEPKQLQSKYLYDPLGSHLFEAICQLPWYHITRAERRLLERFAGAVVAPFRDPVTLVELGCGSGTKIALLAEQLARRDAAVSVRLIDISPTALELSSRTLGTVKNVSVTAHRAVYEVGLRQATSARPARATILVAFLGSNLGNFDPPAAHALLREIRRALRPGDAFLLGADLVKPETELLLAYDDPLGVTAAFNKNLLARINGELGGTFDLAAFAHRAVWNREESRVEMHLVARAPQEVTIAASDVTVRFAAGEPIWTESSYKYAPEEIVEMVSAAGFRRLDQWVDREARFALTLFSAH